MFRSGIGLFTALCLGWCLCTNSVLAESKTNKESTRPTKTGQAGQRIDGSGLFLSNGPGQGASYGTPRGGNTIHSGIPACDDLGVCDLQVGIGGAPIDQPCPGSEWISLAFPVQTDGALVSAVNMTHNTNTGGGHLYLLNDCGGNPNVNDILYTGCGAIVAGNTGPQVYTIDPPVLTGTTTWVVAVFAAEFSFDVAYNSAVPDPSGLTPGLGYGNLSGSGTNGSWIDLSTITPDPFGYCYCVSVETTEPSSTCCETPAVCAGDANGDGMVDPLDDGGVLARFGLDTTAPGVCQWDVNCDGVIDPLDKGYVDARFGTCGPVVNCAPGGGECGPGGGDPPPPPANDDCANATLVLAGSHAFDNTAATTDGPLDCDPSTGNNDLWYNYTATADGTLLVSLCQDTDFDSTLSVYSGTGCPVGAPLACSDDDCQDPGGPSEISISVTNGQQIKARVAGWTDGNCDANPTGTGTLTIELTPVGQGSCCFADETCDILTSSGCTGTGGTYNGDGTVCSVNLCAIGASNDVCADVVPTLLNVGETITFTGDNSDAAIDDCDVFFELEVWEAFTTTETMDVTLDYCGTGGTFSPVWPYVDASCPCGAFILGDGDFLTCENAETQFIMTLPNLAPGTYYHPVYASPDGTLGPYTINVTGTLPPADCCVEHPQPGCDEIDGEPVEGVDDCVCAVDSFCCDSTWDITCVEEVESLGCADCPDVLPPPENDECTGAIALECDTSDTVNGIDYTTNPDDPVSTCEIASGGPFSKDTSWWYSITVPSGTTSFTVELCDSSGDADSDTVVTLFRRTSTCDALVQQKCGEDECTFPAFGPSIVTLSNPVANDDYLFLVDVYSPSDDDAVYVTTLTCVP